MMLIFHIPVRFVGIFFQVRNLVALGIATCCVFRVILSLVYPKMTEASSLVGTMKFIQMKTSSPRATLLSVMTCTHSFLSGSSVFISRHNLVSVNAYNPVKGYLKILLQIRQELAISLDIEKFKYILNGNNKWAIFYRNYWLLKLYEYKTKTKKNILILSNRLNEDNNQEIIEPMTKNYGLSKINIDFLNEFLNRIKV